MKTDHLHIRIFLSLFVLLSAVLPASADDWKIVERSEKKTPAWINESAPSGYLYITSEAPSLQEARRMAEQDILRTIIQAIAVNVKFSQKENSVNITENDRVNTTETYKSEYEMAAAKLPFMKGVSLTEAKATYWERRENKKSKQNLYIFNVLYPLSDYELAQLRDQFDKYDGEKAAALQEWQNRYYNVASAEEVNEGIAKLTEVEEYFFDSVRKKEAAELIRRYRDIMKGVSLTGEKVADGKYVLRTELRGKPFAVGKVPQVTSECANNIVVKPAGNGTEFNVTYSTEDCLDTELNNLDVTLRAGSARISVKFPI